MNNDVGYLISVLLKYNKVLTIQKTANGLMVSFSEMDEYEDGLVFIPEQIMKSESSLAEALTSFHEHQTMLNMSEYQA